MTIFVEDPLMRIVAVHWADDDGEPEPPDLGPPYCGRYGYGARMEDTGILIGAVPYGPNQFPPMVGTFSTSSNTGAGGEKYGGLSAPLMHPTPTLTAPPDGLHANNILLGGNDMQFTNYQLMSLQDASGNFGTIGWVAPMATGQTASGSVPNVGIPIVIKSYAIAMEWVCNFTNPADQVGIGISHLIPGHVGPISGPPAPAVVLGPKAGGSGSFSYDFKYAEWARGDIHVNEDNQFDPALGGPALLWWMAQRAGGVWSASPQFMLNTLVGLNDHYTWEIVATCQQLPPL